MIPFNIWLDDYLEPIPYVTMYIPIAQNDWNYCKNSDQFKAMVEKAIGESQPLGVISLDHGLDYSPMNGTACGEWLIERLREELNKPTSPLRFSSDFAIEGHSGMFHRKEHMTQLGTNAVNEFKNHPTYTDKLIIVKNTFTDSSY